MRRRLSATRLGEELRQRRHHRAFRIGPPEFGAPAREDLERLLAAVSAVSSDPAGPAGPAGPGEDVRDEPGPVLDEKALADAATSLWRAQRRLARDGEKPSERSRQTGRLLRACRTALTDAGLVVQDHDGDAFHSGRSLEVLVFQDDPSLTAETVLETVRPTVYLRDRRIRMGQVIVGRPSHDNGTPPGADGPDKERTGHA